MQRVDIKFSIASRINLNFYYLYRSLGIFLLKKQVFESAASASSSDNSYRLRETKFAFCYLNEK